MPYLDDKWKSVKNKALSEDEFDRLAALSRSVLYTELALKAVGTKCKNGRSVTQLFNKFANQNKYSNSEINHYKSIFHKRNLAVHSRQIPSARECSGMVEDLYNLWIELRGRFVTIGKAAELAGEILSVNTFSNVFLFGSLTRRKKQPGDIDLLIFDDGEISSLIELYKDWRDFISLRVLETAEIKEEAYAAAIQLDWIDIVVVDQKEFCNNPKYIRNLASVESPLFLLTITDRIKEYSQNTKTWVGCNKEPFIKWEAIRRELVKEGIIPEHW